MHLFLTPPTEPESQPPWWSRAGSQFGPLISPSGDAALRGHAQPLRAPIKSAPPGSGPLGSTGGHSGLQVKAVGFVVVSGDDTSGGLQKWI